MNESSSRSFVFVDFLSVSGFELKMIGYAFLLIIGFDFLLHASILEPIYLQESPFLLDLSTAFYLIPLGYISFLILTFLQAIYMKHLGILDWKNGLKFGLFFGVSIWGSLILGLLSISTIPLDLALGWFLGQSLELSVSGMYIGHVLDQQRLNARFIVLAFVILLLIGILIQNVN